ncbi:MAG: nitroreductase family protein [Anaerolineales bacterium]|nr:nitroreductase family protein [Anaerolineales bacterium]
MFNTNLPTTEIIQQRFSCRVYNPEPIPADKRQQLQAFIAGLSPGPFGLKPRFDLLAATQEDSQSLRGLGTYGFIKNAPAFIVGAMTPADFWLEDFGYLMETIILYATSLALGTCWLGGTFTKSRFAQKLHLAADEVMPAITSVGEFAAPGQMRQGQISQIAGSHHRLPWEVLFFKDQLQTPISPEEAGDYAAVLDMVRLAPSASNKQPWRIIKHRDLWRFYLQRTPGYAKGVLNKLLDISDLQRVDMGIAMCHFELTAHALGLNGVWVIEDSIEKYPEEMPEYLVSWRSQP